MTGGSAIFGGCMKAYMEWSAFRGYEYWVSNIDLGVVTMAEWKDQAEKHGPFSTQIEAIDHARRNAGWVVWLQPGHFGPNPSVRLPTIPPYD